MQTLGKYLLIPVLNLLLTAAASSGVLLVSTVESPDEPGQTMEQRAMVGQNAMRVELKTVQGDAVAIFRQDKDLFWLIEQDEGSYVEMTRADLIKLRQQMDQALQMMQEQMKNLPPEQRAMMESMMKSKMPDRPQEPTYKKIASGVKVHSWICDQYEGSVNGLKKQDIWTVAWKTLKMDPEEFEVMRAMGDFFKEIAPQEAGFFQVGSAEVQGETASGEFSGLPVKMISYTEDQPEFKMELINVEKTTFPPQIFELPDGLQKKDLMDWRDHD